MRRIGIVIFYPILFIFSLPYLLIGYIASLFNRQLGRRISYSFMRFVSVSLMTLSGANYQVEGLDYIDESRNYLFVSNHRGLMDTPTLVKFVKKPLSFISKMEMAKVPIVKQWMDLLQCLFLDRKDNRQAVKIFLQGIENLKAGDHMAIYPQGTRSRGNEFLPFKHGSFKLALKSGVAIIPVAIKGTAVNLEENNRNVRPCKIYVTFGAPIETAHLTREEQLALPEKIEKQIKKTFDQFGPCI